MFSGFPMSETPEDLLHNAATRFNNADELYPAVYLDLKRMARQHLRRGSNYTDLPVTVLVHESFARLGNLRLPIDRAQFFSYAARAMRSIIVDYVRSRDAAKRGGAQVNLTLADDVAAAPLDHEQIISVDRALLELEVADKRAHDLVELRFFAGFTLEECAQQLDISLATAQRDWRKARAFLAMVLRETEA